MIGLLQRVTQARVEVAGETVAEIQRGLLVLTGVEKGDTEARAERLLARLLGYRVFPDESGRMNLSLQDIEGGLLTGIFGADMQVSLTNDGPVTFWLQC